MMSGIQHYCFCRRQWALIHVEQQWADNWRTIAGDIVHERVHDEHVRIEHEGMFEIRGLRVSSSALRLSGICDLVEFRQSDSGCIVAGHKGRWQIIPVEYKRGVSRDDDADRCQLCAQVIALEEMFCTSIQSGYVYHHEARRRELVEMDESLRTRTATVANDMWNMFLSDKSPSPDMYKHCRACSLSSLCLPELAAADVKGYMNEVIGGDR